jgi:hypothetical protein
LIRAPFQPSWGSTTAAGSAPANRKDARMRDWLETHAPRLVGVWDWPRYRLVGRCLACNRPMILHSPWALFVCERTPLPIEITDKGRALVDAGAADTAEPEPATATLLV